MGRKGSGVEVRPRSIRLSFKCDDKPVKRTLTIGDKPMPPTPANVKYAHRLAAEIKDKIRHDTFSMAEYFPADGSAYTGTFGAQLDSSLAARRIEKSTRSGYASGVNFWKESEVLNVGRLGDMPLRSVRTSHLMTAIASRPDLSGKTINNYVAVARDALELAVIDKLIASNPAAALKRAKYQKPPVDPFSADEAEAIIEGARDRYPSQTANLIETWIWAGPRTSEIFGLRWPNVLLPTERLVVSEALVAGERKDTKTSVAREVILNSRSLAALQRQREHTQLRGETVFVDPATGLSWDVQDFLKHVWKPLLARLGIRYRRPYNMRHTYATAMLMAGMMPAFCAKQLGHSVAEFLKTYARWLDGAQNDVEMNRLETALRGRIGGK